MKQYTCSKELYVNFLKLTSERYSAFSLAEVSPIELSHDAVSRWLADTKFQPKNIWEEASKCVLNTQGVIIRRVAKTPWDTNISIPRFLDLDLLCKREVVVPDTTCQKH